MKYLGGKHKVGRKIAAFMTRQCPPDTVDGYYEPFCGSLGVFKQMVDKGYHSYTASDAHPDLIKMWKDIQAGQLKLPSRVSEKQYYMLKKSKSPNSMKAVAGFGLSYGGKYFAGYAQNAAGTSGRNFLKEFKRSVAKTKLKIQRKNVVFKKREYWEYTPHNELVYCDPPYANTEGYSTGGFDHKKFWDTMRKWSKSNCVFISEEQAPTDFKAVMTFSKRRTLDGQHRFNRVEKLYVYSPSKTKRKKRLSKSKNTMKNK